ncbi:MAG TPA: VOC family protein [Hyphomicrobiaceae bacterium]|nr:VOC family protein [Hyphomicrobiaceae bacterium]
MTADVCKLLRVSVLAAAFDRAAGRARRAFFDLWGVVQMRLDLPRRAPPRRPLRRTPVIPTVRYRDVPAAIRWLCRAFGMRAHRIVRDANGVPCYAELTVGTGMLMVAPIEDTAFGKLMVQPDEIGGVETQVCYLCVANAHAHYARAKAAGAAIVLDIEHETNRGRGYSCRDPEGHVWNFGTYDPWEKQSQPVARGEGRGLRHLQQGLAVLAVAALAAGLLSHAMPQPSARAGTAVTEPPSQQPQSVSRPRPVIGGAIATEKAEHAVEMHSVALAVAERTAAEARADLAQVRAALEKAQRDASAARTQTEEMQRARLAAERVALEAREHLAAAQKSVERAREQAAVERIRRLAAERARRWAQTRRRASFAATRERLRSWCYSINGSNPSSTGTARLTGFCRG